MEEHTPTPWYLIADDGADFTAIATKPEIDGAADFDSEVLGTSEWLRVDPKDIRFMVRAVNAHDALVAALVAMRAEFRAADLPYGSSAYIQSGAALALARGESGGV